MSAVTAYVAAAALLGSAVIGGVFFAFSSFVMKALARVPASAGIGAMQSINVVVLNASFLGTFFGTAVLSLATAVLATTAWGTPGAVLFLAGAVCYFAGTFVVTMTGNVPLNNELARVSADDPAAASVWSRYLRRWTMLNTVRAIAAIAAALMHALGLLANSIG